MKLYERLPDSIIYGGKKYRLDMRYTTVLAALDVLGDEELTAQEREFAALSLLVDGKHPADRAMLSAVLGLISPEKKRKKDGPPSMDITQDWEYIYAGFLQAYGIDLFDSSMHWLKFCALLKSLPKGTRLREIVEIRTAPVPKPTKHNREQIAALLKAKADVALKATETSLETGLQALYLTLKHQAIGR